MSGSAASWRGRWPALGVALVVAAIAVTVIATRTGSKKSPVLVVLIHAATRIDSPDFVDAVNESSDTVGYGHCVGVMPRTAAAFRLPRGVFRCLHNASLAPHSRQRLRTSLQFAVPGHYWAWVQYWRKGVAHGTVHTAYTKLTIVGRDTGVSVVLAHATIRVGSSDVVEIVNRGKYRAESSGYGCTPSVSPRTNANFTRPSVGMCAGGGPGIAPHSHLRVETPRLPKTPGNYWVWFDYFYDNAAETEQIADTASAKLTIRHS